MAGFCGVLLHGQNEPHGCGTPPIKTKWFKKYVKNREAYRTDSSTVLFVPIKIHNVGRDDGSSLFPVRGIVDAMCTLNEDFEAANIQFYIDGEINVILNSAYNNHATVLEGAEMMFENNVDSAINVYFVANPAGNCGYNLPYAGIAMSRGCSGPDDHTFAHEVGHNLTVQHPHLGWDGNVYQVGQPAPTMTTYDYTYFKDTLILDTLIIDTSIVEYADGSNCEIAGDFLCDTHADYLSTRWTCNGDLESNTQQIDPNGESFRSDATLIMSYALDDCSSRFTPDQIALMRANLLDEKSHYLNRRDTLPDLQDIARPGAPSDDEEVHYENIVLEWDAVQDAEYYSVELSRLPTFGLIDYTGVTSDPMLVVPELQLGRRYFWRIKTFNSFSFCSEISANESFVTANLSSTHTQAEKLGLLIYPNPSVEGQLIHIKKPQSLSNVADIAVFDAQGRQLTTQLDDQRDHIMIRISESYQGVVMLRLRIGEQLVYKKLTVIKS